MASRTCPACGKDRVCSPAGARNIYQTGSWPNESLLDEAERVCSYCQAVRIDGQWCDRLQSASERAWELAQAGSKSHDEYTEILGELPDDKPRAGGDRAVDTSESDFEW